MEPIVLAVVKDSQEDSDMERSLNLKLQESRVICQECDKEIQFPARKNQKCHTACSKNYSQRNWQRKRLKIKPENYRGKYKPKQR